MIWIVIAIFIVLLQFTQCVNRPNIIFILADDLGYGDLGFSPFNSKMMKNIQTPNLKRLALNGLTLSNFHTASSVCSPSRASIMVGLFPWRLGIDFIYSQDLKLDGTIELSKEQLPLIPNIAMSLRDNGYYTAHIGKWHLGGMYDSEIKSRLTLRSNCSFPGINQYGFDEYVAMSEGIGSSRYLTHKNGNTYSTGAKYLLKNDIPYTNSSNAEILTDIQTTEAIRVIQTQSYLNKPFFVNLWYDAPHSPWEAIEPFYSEYINDFETERNRKYASMISNMDYNIGRILDTVEKLGIVNDTIIMFTSDNGPENDAGSPGNLKGRKRYLTEGGIKVPCLIQWPNRIKSGIVSDKFTLSTDIYPTLLHAAKIKFPSHVRIDGVSFLSVLLGSDKSLIGDERTVLWYVHCLDTPVYTAARSIGYKLLWSDYQGRPSRNLPPSIRLYNIVDDPYEKNDLLPLISNCADFESYPSVSWNELDNFRYNSSIPLNQLTTSNLYYKQSLLQLVNYLLLKMYVFRYFGDYDWRNYHKLKPYQSNPNCIIRKQTIDTITWTNHIIYPEFCGSKMFTEMGSLTCLCGLSTTCSQYWFNRANVFDSQNVIRSTLSKNLPCNSPYYDTLSNYLSIVKYNPVCLKDIRNSESYVNNNNLSCHTSISVSNDGWAYGEITSLQPYHSKCHQRVNRFGKMITIQGTNCGADTKLFTLNSYGITNPLFLCKQSLDKYLVDDGYIDDNLLVIIFHLYSKSTNSLTINSIDPSKLTDVVIIDPLFYHIWFSNNIQSSVALEHDLIYPRNHTYRQSNSRFIEFYRPFVDNLKSTNHIKPVNTILFPVYHMGYWGLLTITGLSPKSNKAIKPIAIVFDPMNVFASTKSFLIWQSFVRRTITNLLINSYPYKVNINLTDIDFVINTTSSGSNWRDSGSRSIVFVREILKLSQIDKAIDSKVIKMISKLISDNTEVKNEKNKLIQLLQSLFQNYEKTLASYLFDMSKPIYGKV